MQMILGSRFRDSFAVVIAKVGLVEAVLMLASSPLCTSYPITGQEIFVWFDSDKNVAIDMSALDGLC